MPRATVSAISDADGEAEGVAEGGGIQGEVGAQHGEDAGEAEAPGLRGLAAVELPGAGLTAVRGEFQGGGELPAERVELAADVVEGDREGGGVVGGVRGAQAFGEFA